VTCSTAPGGERGGTIVVLRALGLGDAITGLPALRLLRSVRPDDRIVLATPARWAPIVALADPSVEVLDTEELAPLVGAPERPDLAVDLHGSGPASRRILEPLRPRRLLAYAGGPVGWRHLEHETARWCRLLREGLSLPDDGPDGPCPDLGGILGAPPPGPDGATVVHCGAAAASRRWPADRFAEVAAALRAEGHDVVVTGGVHERALAASIACAAHVPAVTTLPLLALLGLVGRARLVISGDTGVAHLASAYEVPSVTLCGPVSPVRWGPPDRPWHRVIWHGDDTGDPHGSEIDPALRRIDVAEVLTAATTALTADAAAPRGWRASSTPG
jgi:ADP-heptose:LPS heptosyltransferase